MGNEYEFRFTAGVLVRKHIRTILEGARFVGHNIRWMEEKGWLDSEFRVRGEYDVAKALESRIDAYSRTLGDS